MAHYQDIVGEYLKANRATFINPEFFLQLDEGKQLTDRSWWVDILAVSFEEQTVYLCEVTYAQTLAALVERLRSWAQHWDAVRFALARDTAIPSDWDIKVRVFIPEALLPKLSRRLAGQHWPFSIIPMSLEQTVPWRYCTWDRKATDLLISREET